MPHYADRWTAEVKIPKPGERSDSDIASAAVSIAESAVRYLLGVKGVLNCIQVRSEVKATDVKEKNQSAFQRQASLDAQNIKVNVDDSAVVLQGTVHSWREKDDAAIAAWAAPGVTKVENKLQVQL